MIRLCATAALPEGQSRGFTSSQSERLMAVRRDGRVYTYLNRCPHRGIALEWQPDRFLDDSGSLIQCATHGALFLIETGECVAGPCAGEALTAVQCIERDGSIWLHSHAPCDR